MLFQQAGRASARWATVQSGVHSNRVALAHLSSARVSVPSNPFAALLSGFLHQSPSPALSEARRTYATGAATATAAAPAQGPRPSAALKKPKKARGGRPKGSAKPKSATKAKPKRAVKAKKPAARKAAKPKKKAAPAKPKRKKKAAPAKPKRKVLTEKQKVVVANKKRAAVLRELRTKALAPPSAGLKMTAWMQLVAETNTGRKGTQAPAAVREAAAKYKSLSPKEHEEYNHAATEIRRQAEARYKQWLAAQTPAAIYDANQARGQLRRLGARGKYPQIRDPRAVKRPTMARVLFLKERFASGDMKGIKSPEVFKLVAREWDGLSDAQKKPYYQSEIRDRERYAREVKNVYDRDIGLTSDTKAAQAVAA